MGPHDQRALIRSVDSLAFLVRDTAHVTPANFEICVDAIRAFVEASMNGVNKIPTRSQKKVWSFVSIEFLHLLPDDYPSEIQVKSSGTFSWKRPECLILVVFQARKYEIHAQFYLILK